MAAAPVASNYAVVRSTTPTSTGTKNFTSSGLGDPSGIIVQVVPTTSDDTNTAGLNYSWGVSDGVNDRADCGFSEHAVGTSSAGNAGSVDHCVYLLDDAGTTVLVEATFNAWVTDGVQLDFTVVDSTAWTIVVTLFGGDEILAAVGDANVSAGSTSEITTESPAEDASFEPDVVFTAQMGSVDESVDADMQTFFGIAANESGGANNTCAGMLSEDGAGTTDTRRRFIDGRLGERYIWFGGAPSFQEDVYISAYSSSGFTLKRTGSSNPSPRILFLALKLSDNGDVGFALSTGDNTPTVTGTQARTFPGHETGFLYSVNSATTTASLQTAGAMGASITDVTTEFAFTIRDKRNVGTSNTAVYTSASLFDMYNHNGATHLYKASLDSQDASGYTADFSIVHANARNYGHLSIQRVDGLTRGSLAASATVSGTLVGVGALAGAIAGLSTTTAVILGIGPIAGTVAGVASTSATLFGTGSLVGTVAGLSTTSATLLGTGALAGVTAGLAATSGTLAGTALISGSIAGLSTTTGTMFATGALAGTIAGTSTITGALQATGFLSGSVAGLATTTADLGGVGALSGSVAGLATVSGDLSFTAPGVLAGSIAGVATTTGVLVGTGQLSGSIAGLATVVAIISSLGGVTIRECITLTASLDKLVSLNGSRNLIDALLASRNLVDGLSASRDAVAGLDARYDRTTGLSGDFRECN